MKHRLGALAMVAMGSFLCGGWLLNHEPAGEANVQHQSRVLETVLSVIYDHSLDSPNRTELFENTARALVSQLRDPYAELLVGDGYRQFNRQMSGTGATVLPTGGDRATGGEATRIPATSTGVLLSPAVGYVALHTLSDGAAEELATEVWSLRKQGMRTLVLDLRNNPGGLIKQGVQVAELFLNEGDTIATTRGRKASHTKAYVAGSGERWPGLMVTLLVNDGTASSAELIAGALQDHDRVAVVGQPTFGKGVLQTTYPLGGEMAIKLTTARWYTPSGRSINRPRTRSDSVVAGRRRAAEASGARFVSDHGRRLPEGHGIMPDLVVRRDGYTPRERAFLDSLGSSYPAFRAALSDVALNARGDGNVVTEDFEVTPEMRVRVYGALVERRVQMSPELFASASRYVDRQLGNEIARELFGDAAATRRRLLADRQMQATLDLINRSATQADLLRLADENPE
ncbi:MAG TPA: S41 family peptidase [Gemmatimonadales bacterium]|jgi:carboxyl-terminal processing protease|nr:S41 family peptidase [Gemmatimonadales bacterium]